jgi:hypothetical protein
MIVEEHARENREPDGENMGAPGTRDVKKERERNLHDECDEDRLPPEEGGDAECEDRERGKRNRRPPVRELCARVIGARLCFGPHERQERRPERQGGDR